MAPGHKVIVPVVNDNNMRDEHGTDGKRPVVEGQVYDVTITDIGERGDGIGKIDGLVVIVPDANPGETVKVRITRLERKVAFGRKA
jgi:predicted RNA-binding protein with TRAM domain